MIFMSFTCALYHRLGIFRPENFSSVNFLHSLIFVTFRMFYFCHYSVPTKITKFPHLQYPHFRCNMYRQLLHSRGVAIIYHSGEAISGESGPTSPAQISHQ